MKKKEDKETRYYIDLDLKARKIIHWDHDQRDILIAEESKAPAHHRVFITKGQYNKLKKKYQDLND